MASAVNSFSPTDNRPIKVFFQDEGRFGRISKPTACWAPPGFRPTIKAQFIRQYTHVYSAVSPNDGQSVSLILPYVNTAAMKIYLTEVSKQLAEYRVVMIMDKAAWHRSKMLGEFENIRIIYLPPYSPELNPVEHLWEHIRENYLRNFFWTSMDKLENKLESILQKIANFSESIQSLVGFHWAIFNV